MVRLIIHVSCIPSCSVCTSGAALSWNSTEPTRTPTLGMRLSCNFVNVYMIPYCTVHACIPYGQPREEIVRVEQVGEDCRACPARGKLNGEVAGHADFRARILARRGSSRGSRQGCPCQCRFHGIPALQNIMLSVNPMLFLLCLPIAWLVAIFWVCQNHIPCAKQWKVMFISKFYANS